MNEEKKRCKYCDAVIKYGTTCGYCNEKLRLVRKLQAMVRNVKNGGGVKHNASKT